MKAKNKQENLKIMPGLSSDVHVYGMPVKHRLKCQISGMYIFLFYITLNVFAFRLFR